ncbi:MAG: DUF4301 family protein [Balneolia bacterium]|nr:DUF4301 family protein [Balneolia bacterium]
MTPKKHTDALEQAIQHGLTKSEAERQLGLFQEGLPKLKLERPAITGDGILQCNEDKKNQAIKRYKKVLKNNELKVMKFVPASGAASRMFRDLETLLNTNSAIDDATLEGDSKPAAAGKKFIRNITSFAFWDALKTTLSHDGIIADELLKNGEYRPLIEYTLTDKGLNYSAMPKALIDFHKNNASGKVRTSLDEHFAEGALYALNSDGEVHLHFTVSPEFDDAINARIDTLKKAYASEGVHFSIALSHQQPSTDTMAVDMDNKPFEDENGRILFRPGGHGALIENLNRLNADVAFIKNIDNVVPDSLKDDTVEWKQVLGGILIDLREKLFSFRASLIKDKGKVNPDEFAAFCVNELNLSLPEDFNSQNDDTKAELLLKLTNRPIRVCGMVKNEGEPGGGPFWVKKKSYVNKLQIVESSQIDQNDDEQLAILKQSTHFNPVDIVCSLTNDSGQPFDLNSYVDEETAFIANKSYDGRNLKALERPGLWNGGMAGWITIFVEVPISTFNPVKVVNDLLRKHHQD